MIRQLESKSFLFFLRDHLQSTLGITCCRGSFAVHFGDHLRYCTLPRQCACRYRASDNQETVLLTWAHPLYLLSFGTQRKKNKYIAALPSLSKACRKFKILQRRRWRKRHSKGDFAFFPKSFTSSNVDKCHYRVSWNWIPGKAFS